MDSLLESNPDSAYALLTKIQEKVDSLDDTGLSARQLMYKASAQNKLYLKMPSDTIFQSVVDYYAKYGTANDRMKSLYLMGCIYRDMHEAPQALKYYQEATESADTLSSNFDHHLLICIYGQMAHIFHTQYLLDEELTTLDKFGRSAINCGDTNNYILSIERKIPVYYLKDDKAMVDSLTELCHEMYIKNGMPHKAAGVYPTLIYMLLEQEKYASAYTLMREFEKNAGLYNDNGEIIPPREHYYYSKGIYYLGVHELDSAEICFRNLLRYDYHYDAYSGLFEVFCQKENSDSLIKYAGLLQESTSVEISRNQALAVSQTSSMYEYARLERKSEAEKTRAEHRKMELWMSVMLFILTLSIFISLFIRYRIKKQNETIKLRDDYNIAVSRLFFLSEQLNKMERKTEMLRQSHQADQKQIDEILLLVENKTQEIKTLQENIKSYEKKLSDLDKVSGKARLSESEPVVRLRKRLQDHSSVTFQELSNLEEALRMCVPILYFELTMNRKLSPPELHVMIMTMMDFTSSDIHILLNQSLQRVTNLKSIVNKKIFNENGATSLRHNLVNLINKS